MEKKIMNLVFAIVMTIICLFAGKVNASDLSSKIKTNVNDIFGKGGKVTYTYDKENDVTNMLVTVTVDNDTIKKVLDQKPTADGNSNLGYTYIMIDPTVSFTTWYKQNKFFDAASTSTINEQKNIVKKMVGDDDLSRTSAVWPIAMFVEYSLDNGVTWKTSTGTPDGKTSVRDNLLSKFSGKTFNDLVYGKDYRFGMWEKYKWLYVWQNAKENPTSSEWINVSYQIKFPITATTKDDKKLYYPTLEQAISDEINKININEDIEVKNNITFNPNSKVLIGEGVTITLDKNVNLTNTKVIENNGTIIDSNKDKYYTIKTSDDAEVSENLVKTGESVKVTVTEKEGYNVKLIVTNIAKDEVISTIQDVFTMPDSNVSIEVIYDKSDVTIISGSKAIYNNEDLVIEYDIDSTLFDKLYINDEELDKTKYEVSEGKTKVTISKEYLDTLEAGDYTVKAEFTNGSVAVSTLTKKEIETIEENKEENKVKDKEEKNPQTLDMITIYLMIGIVSIIAIAGSATYMKKVK